MQEVLEFLKKCGIYYLATVEGDQPRVRPFGTIHQFEGKLYIQTGKVKDASKQMHQSPKIEICAFGNGKWIRVAVTAVEDDRTCARRSMLDAYPSLQKSYQADEEYYPAQPTSIGIGCAGVFYFATVMNHSTVCGS